MPISPSQGSLRTIEADPVLHFQVDGSTCLGREHCPLRLGRFGDDLLEPLRRLTYRVAEVAVVSGMGERHVRALIKAGVIPSVRLGDCVLIPVAGLEQLLRGEVDGDE